MKGIIKDIAPYLRVGMIVRTNGNCAMERSILVEGEIGEINGGRFYIWQNEHEGHRNEEPVGYDYSWQVYLNNTVATVEIISGGLSMIHPTIKQPTK